MILLYPKKRKNKDTFFIFPRAEDKRRHKGRYAGNVPSGPFPAAGGPALPKRAQKETSGGGTVLSRRRQWAKAAAPLPRNDGLTLPPRGAHRLFRAPGGRGRLISRRRHRSAGGSALPNRREKETSEAKQFFRAADNGRRHGPAPPKRRAHIAPRGAHKLFRATCGRGRLISRRHCSAGGRTLPKRAQKETSRGNSSFAPQTTGEGTAPLPRNDGLTLRPRGAHRFFRAAGGGSRLISRRHRSAGGSAKWSVTAAPSMRR